MSIFLTTQRFKKTNTRQIEVSCLCCVLVDPNARFVEDPIRRCCATKLPLRCFLPRFTAMVLRLNGFHSDVVRDVHTLPLCVHVCSRLVTMASSLFVSDFSGDASWTTRVYCVALFFLTPLIFFRCVSQHSARLSRDIAPEVRN